MYQVENRFSYMIPFKSIYDTIFNDTLFNLNLINHAISLYVEFSPFIRLKQQLKSR